MDLMVWAVWTGNLKGAPPSTTWARVRSSVYRRSDASPDGQVLADLTFTGSQ